MAGGVRTAQTGCLRVMDGLTDSCRALRVRAGVIFIHRTPPVRLRRPRKGTDMEADSKAAAGKSAPAGSILPCPFCGGDHLGIGRSFGCEEGNYNTAIYCARCGARGPSIYTHDKAIWTDTAFAAEQTGWNRRSNVNGEVCGASPHTSRHVVLRGIDTDKCKQIVADRLAYTVAKLIQAGHLDSRSAAADALLDYLGIGQPGEPQDVPTWMDRYEASQNASLQRQEPRQ